VLENPVIIFRDDKDTATELFSPSKTSNNPSQMPRVAASAMAWLNHD
jgi:hypothetical protein